MFVLGLKIICYQTLNLSKRKEENKHNESIYFGNSKRVNRVLINLNAQKKFNN